MQKPQYELGPLKIAVVQCRINIAAFQNAITKEEKKIDELQGYIRQWEEYNKEQDGDTSKPVGQP